MIVSFVYFHYFFLNRERLKLPESDQGTIDANDTMSAKHQEILTENEHLRVRMEEIEQLCQDVMEENDMLKEDQEEMQREIEEMHDHFQVKIRFM